MKDFWTYVKNFEPARLRSVWIAIAGLVTALGFTVSQSVDQKAAAVIALVSVLLPLIQGQWTRSAVVPVIKYDEDVEAALYTPVPADDAPQVDELEVG